MPKLFVAANLPSDDEGPLGALLDARPAAIPGIRLTRADQMHITLHYIGEADLGEVKAALQGCSAPQVQLVISGVGQFRAPDSTATLWARVEPTAALLELHAAVAEALAPTGFRAEARPYTPHISLARCEPSVPPAAIGAFLTKGEALRWVGGVESVGLFSSVFIDGVPHYSCEASLSLRR